MTTLVLVYTRARGNVPTMAIRARGRVEGGHLRVDIPVDLPDNTEVELVEVTSGTDPEDEELDPLLEAVLERADAAIASGERGQPAEEVLEELRARRRDEALSGAVSKRG